MNYLAHLYLSPPGDDALLGSLLGDFVKGPVNSELRRRYGDEVTRAIVLHRKIDSFTDAHPLVRDSRNRISRARRRFAGVMIDLFYDHFLAKNWHEFHHQPLEEFTRQFYSILTSRHEQLPERLQRVAHSIVSLDWLGSYADVESVATALDRMSRRLRRENALVYSGEELLLNYAELENDFRQFIPKALEFARAQGDVLGQFKQTQ